MKRIIELMQQRARIVAQQRALYDGAERENRSLTAEEQEQDRRMDADFERLSREIETIEGRERLEEREQVMAGRSTFGDPTRPEPNGNPGQVDPFTGMGRGRGNDGEYRFWQNPNGRGERRSFERYLVHGRHALNADEIRALQSDSGPAGGYLNIPLELANELLKAIDDETFVNRIVRTYNLTAAVSLGIPTLENDPDDADWTTELQTGSEDTSMSFGRRELHPHPMAKRIKVSNHLLRIASLNPGDIVRDRLAYKFTVTLEKAFMTGSGAGQPLGIFTVSDDGIPASRDVTGSSSTLVMGDDLIDLYHGVKPQYRRRGSFIFHDDAIKQIRKLKDGDGQYLWAPGLVAGQPDTILSRPVYNSQFAPNTLTSGNYAGAFGDFMFYWMAYALRMDIKVLEELYAETNQTGYIGRMEADGMPALAEAFARLKLA